jgi:predicted RNase H-like HicB family nuclease
MGMEEVMRYPVVIHKDSESCFGVTVPDIPGCFTFGDTLEEALKNIQEAVECHLHDSATLPPPSPLEKHLANPDYADGVWVLVEVNKSFLSRRHRRINISIPEELLHRIDHRAKQQGLSRSGFLVKAARQSLE